MTTEQQRSHPAWEEMRAFLDSGAPSLHVIDGEPPVSIFIDPMQPRLGMRVPFPSGELPQEAPLAEIDTRVGLVGGTRALEISTANQSLFAIFFPFALSLADRIQVEQIDVSSAVKGSLEQWRALLRQAAMLSADEQTGLMGELWMLGRLAESSPKIAIGAWTGPAGEAHDFRLDSREFEVKATRAERRAHVISSMTQLVPSPGRSLFILSLQFAASGAAAGTSLSERLASLRLLFEKDGIASEFDRAIRARFGLDSTNWGFYRQPLQLRSRPVLVAVDGNLASIRQEDVSAIPRSEMERVSDVRYRLDLTGLGVEDGSREFASVIPQPEEVQ